MRMNKRFSQRTIVREDFPWFVDFVEDFKNVAYSCASSGFIADYDSEKERYIISEHTFLSLLKINPFATAEDKLYLLKSLKWVQECLHNKSRSYITVNYSLLNAFGVTLPKTKLAPKMNFIFDETDSNPERIMGPPASGSGDDA